MVNPPTLWSKPTLGAKPMGRALPKNPLTLSTFMGNRPTFWARGDSHAATLQNLGFRFNSNILCDATSVVISWQGPNHSEPPKCAEFLIYLFLPKKDREILAGDLREEFIEVLLKFGHRSATIWFYKQAFASLWPLIRRIILKWGLLGTISHLIRRIFS
jgi:hypothetical protein